MGSGWTAFGEFLLFDGLVIAWGIWELWSLRRERRRDAEANKPGPDDGP